jgi:post-segregation antitoxin (ccd killing protein)
LIKYNGKFYQNLNGGFSVTRKSADLRKINERQIDYTSEFKLPMVDDFKPLENINGSNFDLLNKYIEVDVYVNNFPVMQGVRGVIKSIDWNERTFKLVVYGQEIDFLGKLKKAKIRDLDLSGLVHTINPTNFINNITAGWTNGFAYAIADYGNFNDDNGKIYTDYQMPVVYVRWLWERMLELIGLRSSWSPPTNVAITGKRGWVAKDGLVDVFDYTFHPDFLPFDNGETGYKRMVITPDGNLQPVNPDGYTLQVNKNGYYDLKYQLSVTIDDGWGEIDYIDVIKNNSENLTRILPRKVGNTYEINVELEYFLNAGDKIQLWVSGGVKECDVIEDYSTGGQELDCIDNHYTTQVNDLIFKTSDEQGAKYTPAEFIGDLSLFDFFKDLLNYYGVTFRLQGDLLIFKKWKDIINLKSTKKLIVNKINNVKRLPDMAQDNGLEWSYTDENSKKLGDSVIRVENDVLPEYRTLFKRPFDFVGKSNETLEDKQLLYIPFWQPKFDNEGNLKEWKPVSRKMAWVEVEQVDALIKYGTTTGGTNYRNGSVNIITNDDAHWEISKRDNYGFVSDTYRNYVEIEAVVDLDLLDFLTLDLFQTYYVQQFSFWIFVNQIKYINGDVVINGIKIINNDNYNRDNESGSLRTEKK